MNALTKRLLSFLVVMTMVIGMVPAVGLPAVVAKADTALTINEQASAMTFTGGTDNLYCPVCDAPVDWVPLTEGGAIATPAKSTHVHYYVYGSSVNVTATSAKSGSTTLGVIANLANSGSKICLNLNGHNLVAPCGFRLGSSSVALNIMGEGAMTYTDTGFDSYSRNKGLFYIENGAVNLYGGTYYDIKPANTKPLVQGYTQNRVTLSVHEGAKLFGTAVIPMLWKINVSGNSFIQNLQITDTAVQSGAAITIAEDFTGNIWNVSFPGGIAEDGTIATGKVTSFTGNITTADGKKIEAVDGALKTTTAITTPTETAFEPDTHNGNAWCEHCQDFVDWVPYFGNNSAVLRNSADVFHYHIYLTEDVNYTGGDANGNFIRSEKNICLNLNGYDVSGLDADGKTAGKRAMLVTQTLAIMGDGSITAGKTNSGDGAVAKNMKEFYLYGGANLATVAGDSSPVITCAGNITLNGGSITGFVSDKSAAATISLANGASADLIKMTNAASKLSVAAGWSGEAVVDPAALEDGILGDALGAFTGKLTTVTGDEVSVVDGVLRVKQPTADTFDPWNYAGKAYCQVCDGIVDWVDYNAHVAKNGYYDNNNKLSITGDVHTVHYYLSDDITYTTQCFSTNEIIHFNFNGCDVTATGDEATSAFRFTQKAHFFNTGDVATVTGGIAGTVGAALENAGNVKVDNEADTWIYGNIVLTKLSGGTAPVVNMGVELNQLTLIGNPVIQGVDGQGLVLGATGTLVDVSGLTEGASIAMSGLTVGEAFTVACDNAEAVKGYVSCADTALPVSVLDDQLILIAAAGIVTGETTVWYADNAAAVAAYTAQNFADGAYIELNENEDTLILLGGNYYVNIGGKDIAVSGSGTLYPIDTANDNYQFFGMWTYEGVDVVRDVTLGGKRYITVTDGDTSTHRLDMAINGVNIRTDAAGLYYDAKYLCDSTLAGMVSKYGVILSLRDMPDAVLDSTDKRTELTGLVPGATATSGSVFNIFSTARTAAKNAQYGKMDIYANAYIELDVDGDGNADVLVADNENVGKTAGTAWSLYDALAEMDQNWSDYAEEDRDAVQAFYTTWADYGLSDYGFTNINDLPDVNAGGSEGGATSEDDDLTTEL